MTDDLKARLRGMDGDSMSIKTLDEAADRIEALELALTQSRAETAAVIERAAEVSDRIAKGEITSDVTRNGKPVTRISPAMHQHAVETAGIYVSGQIRALATPDQTAALDAVRAAEREQIAAMVKSYGEGSSRPQCKHDCEALAAAIKGAKA